MKLGWLPKHELGRLGERLAVDYLRRKKYRILKRNYRSGYGEIDCIALDPGSEFTVFVEIKTRTGVSFGLPEEAVDRRKLKEVINTAHRFMAQAGNVPQSMRIDVVSVTLTKDGKLVTIRHLENVTG